MGHDELPTGPEVYPAVVYPRGVYPRLERPQSPLYPDNQPWVDEHPQWDPSEEF